MDSDSASKSAATSPNRVIEGAMWALMSCALLSLLSAFGRHIAKLGVEPSQIVFCRILFAFLCLVPWFVLRSGRLRFSAKQLKLYLIRSIASMCAMTTWFYALSMAPVGEVTALGFLAPLFTTVGAALFLGETVRLRRWTATIIGFCGALIIIRPGMVELGAGGWCAVASAVFMGASSLFIKQLTRGDDPVTIVFLSHLVLIPISIIPALFTWTWPSWDVWMFLLGMGPIAVLAHLALTKAFSVADASVVATFDFAKLPWAVLFGWVAFGEVSDVWTWVGATVIFSAALYIVRRESRIKGR